MSWFKVDDGLPDHPKFELLEDDPQVWANAMAIWLVAGCVCSRHPGRDGVISAAKLRRVTPLVDRDVDAAVDALVDAGLWERVPGESSPSFRFHDWAEWQPSHHEAKEARRRSTERQRRWRERKRNGRVDAGVDGSTETSTNGSTETVPRPVPSRPVPSVKRRASVSRAHAPIGEVEDYDPEAGEGREVTPTTVLVAYKRRYDDRMGDDWQAHASVHRDAETIARWANGTGAKHGIDPRELVDASLDGYFADERRGKAKPPWPLKWLAEGPGAYVAAGRAQQPAKALAPEDRRGPGLARLWDQWEELAPRAMTREQRIARYGHDPVHELLLLGQEAELRARSWSEENYPVPGWGLPESEEQSSERAAAAG